MHPLVWIIDVALFSQLCGDGGVSASYLLPHSQLPITLLESIPGEKVWILLRSNEGDQAFSCIHVSKIEQFEEGLNKGDYLLTVDQARSYRVITKPKNKRYFVHCSALSVGVSRLEKEIENDIQREILSSIAVNLRSPPNSLLDRIAAAPSSKGTPKVRARRLIASVTSLLSLEEVWASKAPVDLPPFAYFAYSKVLHNEGKAVADVLVDSLAEQDPIGGRRNSDKEININDASYSYDDSVPLVDVDLFPIDISKVYARKFLVGEKSAINLDDMMHKAEAAEAVHQSMVREIAARLQSLKHVPLQSESIDLSIQTEMGLIIFEIKSAHADNILAQAAKGIFQLLCYRDALAEEGQATKKAVLVFQKSNAIGLESYIRKIAESVGIEVLFYVAVNDWPGKVSGLSDMID